jgi:opacity protein-like surface antigen
VFAFQLGAGVGYEVFPAAILSIDYRYFQAIDPTFKDQVLGTSFRSEYHSHDIRLGVRYQFWASGTQWLAIALHFRWKKCA